MSGEVKPTELCVLPKYHRDGYCGFVLTNHKEKTRWYCGRLKEAMAIEHMDFETGTGPWGPYEYKVPIQFLE